MAFNKSKALENALKFLNQGKVVQAIGEYQQILRQDPKDQATLMTVGDLFARQGDMTQAVEYFERLAKVYLGDGFNSKAIAIYKKIAKLAPMELAPLERLADLYVQQGVLSEARPLFLQIAEAHLKANHAPKAVEVLQRLLDVEPDNPRVQTRLAELYNVMGQKKEAAQTYFSYAQRLYEQGDAGEAEKLIARALDVDASNPAATLLKAKILVAANKENQAIETLESHPEADAGGEVTNLLVDLELEAERYDKAAERGRNQLVRGSSHYSLMLKVVEAMVEAGHVREALPLLRELRDPLVDASEHDKFVKLLSGAIAKAPEDTKPLEMLADFSRQTSDPSQLTASLTKLVDLYAESGNLSRAEELLHELIDRNKGDERLVARLEQVCAQAVGAPPPVSKVEPPLSMAEVFSRDEPPAREVSRPAAAQEAPPSAEEQLDEETQRYLAQALTDVDLFSSYGLTQKATQLLENVLQRAPRHTPTLERLLDLYLGGGNERRTAELAAQLEQIHLERGDTVNAERFAELRQRFQTVAGLGAEELPPAPPPAETVPTPAVAESAPLPKAQATVSSPAPVEFEIPLPPVGPTPAPTPAHSAIPAPAPPPTPVDVSPAAATEEVDLSDEWEAMVQEVSGPAASAVPEPEATPVKAEQQPSIEPEATKLPEEPTEEAPAAAELELELAPAPPPAESRTGPATTEDFLSELAAEIEEMETPTLHRADAAPPAPAVTGSEPVPEVPSSSLDELSQVFQEFRSELGEMSEGEEEDLETHYNLGIAYREMGLLDEAIGEFQKVSKAIQKGKPFPYAMNCSALLAMSFMDKGEPKIAAMWYQQALGMPGLDQESVLALRYDLGVALDTAGEANAALDNFRQVYAMNIDYRDVADRIAMLQKH